jgi:hypothetical protein
VRLFERGTGAALERYRCCLYFLFKLGHDGLQQRLTKASATSAPRRGAGTFLELGERMYALLMNRLDNLAFCGTHAAANGLAVGHLCNVEAGIFDRSRKQELPPQTSKIFLCAQQIHVAVAVGGVADQNEARQFAVFQC